MVWGYSEKQKVLLDGYKHDERRMKLTEAARGKYPWVKTGRTRITNHVKLGDFKMASSLLNISVLSFSVEQYITKTTE